MFDFIWFIIQVIIGYNLVLPLVLHFFYGLKNHPKSVPLNITENDFGIIVTAYSQTHTLPGVVKSLLALDHGNFLIYIVADNCDTTGLHFNDERVILLRPETVLASNTRSHHYAISHFAREHNYITIIDSDNLAEPDYLKELDVMINHGFAAIQGVRKAKNLNTTYACLDAARDIYYHYYDAKVLFGLGSSSTLAGSGMAFETGLYKNFLASEDVQGAGFDKVLQNFIVDHNLRIAFAEKAVVYDEKTTHSDQLVKQRSRWINTWFKYFYLGFGLILKGIKNLSINQFLFGFILLRPPLFIFILLSGLFMLINVFISPVAALVWILAFVFFIIGFVIALKKSQTDERIYKSLFSIPKFMYYQVLSLMKIHKANQISVATEHTVDREENR